MLLSNKQPAIIYLDKNGLFYCCRILPNVLRLEFPQETVSDFDIINVEKFENLLLSFISANKIPPSYLTIVLSKNILFEKEFAKAKQTETKHITPEAKKTEEDMFEKQIQTFIDNIPFEKVSVKRFNTNNSTKVIATNELLYTKVKDMFKKSGFIVDTVAPVSSLDKFVNTAGEFNMQLCNVLMQKIDVLQQNNFSAQPAPKNINIYAPQAEGEEKKIFGQKITPSTLILIGVFGVLIAVLGFLLLRPSGTPVKKVATTTNQPATNSIAITDPTPTLPSPETASISAELKLSDIKVNILNASGIPKSAENLKKILTGIGIISIDIGNETISGTQKTLIIFSDTLPENIKQIVLTEVKKTYSDITIQEGKDTTYHVTIIIGKTIVKTTPTPNQ